MVDADDLSVLHLVTAEEIFFKQQIETLEELGVDCTVCVVPGGEQIDGALPDKRGIKEYLQYFPKVRRELRSGDFDLIHANYGLTAPYAITQFRLPVVLTLWGSDVVGFDGLLTKSCAWRADAVTVRSAEMRERLGRDDAYIVPSGIDMDLFRPIDRETAREHVGWGLENTHVLFPYSPDYERKNYPLAQQVVEEASTNLEQEISLQMISGVPHDEVPWYMNAADCMLLTANYEGSPNTVKEAMACNVPVVSTDVGDVRERLSGINPGGVATEKSDLVELIVQTLSGPSRSNGRDAVRELSWERIGNQLLRIYSDVIG